MAVVLVEVPAAVVALPEGGEMVFTYAAVLICVAIIAWYVLTYNALVKARNAVDQAWSHIEVELKRRLDLIQNLLETTKGYARYESDTFQRVTQLRAQANPFPSAVAANKFEPELHRTIGQIMVLAEDYPQLRADQSFLNLQTELANTEDRIAERRHAYNQTVNIYRNLVESIPSNVVADIQEMPERAFFDTPDEEVSQAPKVELS